MRFLIILLLLAIFASLASGLVFLIRDNRRANGDEGASKEQPRNRTLKALTWRIGLSVALFLIILLLAR